MEISPALKSFIDLLSSAYFFRFLIIIWYLSSSEEVFVSAEKCCLFSWYDQTHVSEKLYNGVTSVLS